MPASSRPDRPARLGSTASSRLDRPARLGSILPAIALTACFLGACYRPPQACPPGHEETRTSPETFWCQDPATKNAEFVRMHPGTKQAEQRCPFAAGVLSGPFEATHPNGKRWVVGRYEAGQPAGRWTQWDATGQRVAEGDYRDGRLVQGAPVAVASICNTIPALQ